MVGRRKAEEFRNATMLGRLIDWEGLRTKGRLLRLVTFWLLGEFEVIGFLTTHGGQRSMRVNLTVL